MRNEIAVFLYRHGLMMTCRYNDCPNGHRISSLVTCGNCREWMVRGQRFL